jgi:hypothetical protein
VKEVTVIRLIFLSMHRKLRKYPEGSLAALEPKAEEASHLLTAIGNARQRITHRSLLGGERSVSVLGIQILYNLAAISYEPMKRSR